MRWMLVLLMLPLAAQAAVYKCAGADGRMTFSDRPCAGAAASPENQIELRSPQTQTPVQPRVSDALRDAKWQEAQRFYYVEIPALERQAAELMASPDPARQTLGREMAWQAHKGRAAFMEIQRARQAREETEKRYGDAIRQLGGY